MTSIVSYYNDAVQELNSTNLNDLYDTVLEYAASITFAGSLAVGTPTGNNTIIGYFTDTVRTGAPGSDGITVLSNTYSVYQYTDTTQATPSPNVLSLQYETYVEEFGELDVVVLQENYNLMSNIADNILAKMVSGYGVGSYHLGNTTPIGDTGVWQNLGKFEDTLNNFIELNNTYFLWQKISSGNSKTLLTPLKLDFDVVGDYNTSELVEFTTSEINNILYYVERRFLDTGIGTYVLDSSAPVTGVWSNVGVVSDFIRTINTDNYSNEFTGVYNISYELDVPYSTGYTGEFDGQIFIAQSEFNGLTFTGVFSDLYTSDYTADYLNENAINYTGVAPTTYAGPIAYVGDDGQSFVGGVPTTYAGPAGFTNVNAQNFVGGGAASYLGPVTYTGDNASFFTAPGVSYAGGIAQYTGETAFGSSSLDYQGPNTFGSPSYTGVVFQSFAGSVFGSFLQINNYQSDFGPLFQQINYYTGLTGALYTGVVNRYWSASYTNENWFPYNSEPPLYTGPFPFNQPDAFSFNSAPIPYSGPAAFTNPDAQNFTGFVPTSYAGPVTYVGDNGANFTGFVPTAYAGPATFTNPNAANFTGFVPLNYSGVDTYNSVFADTYTTGYISPEYTATYSGPGGEYTGVFVGVFTSEYTGILIYQQMYSTQYDTLYERQTVAPSLQENPSVTLWVRIG